MGGTVLGRTTRGLAVLAVLWSRWRGTAAEVIGRQAVGCCLGGTSR